MYNYAYSVNMIRKYNSFSNERGFMWEQVGTFCIFSQRIEQTELKYKLTQFEQRQATSMAPNALRRHLAFDLRRKLVPLVTPININFSYFLPPEI